jgi:hypothetical protein
MSCRRGYPPRSKPNSIACPRSATGSRRPHDEEGVEVVQRGSASRINEVDCEYAEDNHGSYSLFPRCIFSRREAPWECSYEWAGRQGQQASHAINVGVGRDATVAALASVVAGAVGFKGQIGFDTSRPVGTPPQAAR